MADLAQLNLKVNSTTVVRASRDLDRFARAGNRASEAADRFRMLVAAMATATAGFAAKALREFAKFEQAALSVEALTRSAEDAERIMGKLIDLSERTPFELTGLAENTKMMVAMGTETRNVTKELQIMMDAAAAVGGNRANESLRRLAMNIGEIRAQKFFDLEDLRRLTEINLPVLDILADATVENGRQGVSPGRFRELAEQRRIDGEEAVQAMLEGLKAKFDKFTEALGKTLQGRTLILLNTINNAFIFVGKSISRALDLKVRITDLTDAIRPLRDDMVDAVEIIAKLKDESEATSERAERMAKALRGLGAAINFVGLFAFAKALRSVATGLTAVTAALFANPFTAVLAGISLGVGTLVAFWNETVRIGDTMVEVRDVVLGAWDLISDHLRDSLAAFASEASVLLEVVLRIFKETLDGPIGKVIDNLIDDAYRWFDALVQIAKFAGSTLKVAFETFMGFMLTDGQALLEVLVKVRDALSIDVTSAFGALRTVGGAVMETLTAGFTFLIRLVTELGNRLGDVVGVGMAQVDLSGANLELESILVKRKSILDKFSASRKRDRERFISSDPNEIAPESVETMRLGDLLARANQEMQAAEARIALAEKRLSSQKSRDEMPSLSQMMAETRADVTGLFADNNAAELAGRVAGEEYREAFRKAMDEARQSDGMGIQDLIDDLKSRFGANSDLSQELDSFLDRLSTAAEARRLAREANRVPRGEELGVSAGDPNATKSPINVGQKRGKGTLFGTEYQRFLKDLEHENKLLGLNAEGRQRANLMRQAEDAITKSQGLAKQGLIDDLTKLEESLDKTTAARIGTEMALRHEKQKDPFSIDPVTVAELQSKLEVLQNDEQGILKDQAAAIKALADVEAEIQASTTEAQEKIEEYLDKARLDAVFRSIENGVRDAMTAGFTAAIFDEDWKEALRSALRSAAEQSLSQGINLGLDALAGRDSAGNTQSIFSAIGSLFGGGGGGGEAAVAEGTTEAVATAVVSAMQKADAVRPIEAVVVTAPSEAAADSAAARMTARGARAVAAKAQGRGGISAGTIPAGRR